MQRSREIREMKLDEAVMLLLPATELDHGSEMPSGAVVKPRNLVLERLLFHKLLYG